ncbi:MAG: PDZ domain-containing protein [Ferruginibacter sp.]
MKKELIAAAILCFTALPAALTAQDGKKEKDKVKNKETQEIVIRQEGNKEVKMKIEIDGDKITVNGKPMEEFKDDDISISKRKMTIQDGKGMHFDLSGPEAFAFDFGNNFSGEFPGNWEDGDDEEGVRPFLGVTTDSDDAGAKIAEVVKGSAAEKAGLKKGDIITKIGDEKINGPDELTETIRAKKPKEEIKVVYKRDGKESSVKAVLGEKKVTTKKSWSYSGPRGKAKTFIMPNMEGLDNLDEMDAPGAPMGDVLRLNFPRQKKIGLKLQDTEDGGGVKVINVEDSSAAELAGVKKDDVITEIDGTKIDNTDDAREKLLPEEGKKAYEIKANRNGTPMTFQVKIPRKLKTANF